MINKEMPAVTSTNPVEQKDNGQEPVAYTSVNNQILNKIRQNTKCFHRRFQ